MAGKTLYDKIWDAHLVREYDTGTSLIYIDRHLTHEVTTPQAFEGLRIAKRPYWRPDTTIAVADHNVPTKDLDKGVDPVSKRQLDALEQNCKEWDIPLFSLGDIRQGIVHVVGPEQGACLPGMTIACGDSHTGTNGAVGALAMGIGTSEVEHIMATQCLVMRKTKRMLIDVSGRLPTAVSAKDLILHIIGSIGTAGGIGSTIEYAGEAIRTLSMEGRMTVCNMGVEAGSRAGMIAPDDKTISYLEGRPFAPTGSNWEKAVAAWQDLRSDADAEYDRVVEIDGDAVVPQVSWGTSPEMVVPVTASVPEPDEEPDPEKREGMRRALEYMDLRAGTPMKEIPIDKVFIGSCTNSRIEDLRAAAEVIRGRRKAANVELAMVVPGSGLVKQQAEQEGLDKIFTQAGFEWREPGCSMCLAMNADKLDPGDRCASTSNRNFEGRQGHGGRTHLVSPAMAAAAGVAGHFVDARTF
jgi:3-isopropylmalate/(R)-2-methylmalate dehydratase large subunit